ncbi:MAG: hypothetical protein AAGD00_02770 [Planctomycetota bacterium]
MGVGRSCIESTIRDARGLGCNRSGAAEEVSKGRPVLELPHDAGEGHEPTESARALDAQLRGTLPCVTCKYDLQGIPISGICPECGTAVRATILWRVDPEADEFRPMVSPALASLCLIGWSLSSLVAVLASWLPRVSEFLGGFMLHPPGFAWSTPLTIVAGAAGGLCLLGIIYPVRGGSKLKSLGAAVACLAYIPLLWAVARVRFTIDPVAPFVYGIDGSPEPRLHYRLLIGLCLCVVLLGFRPNARELVKRSLALRTGRVDRQTIYAMVGAVGVAMIGDLVRLGGLSLGSAAPWWLDQVGVMLVGLGSLLLTLGMVSAFVDSWRIARAIRTPSPTLRDIV